MNPKNFPAASECGPTRKLAPKNGNAKPPGKVRHCIYGIRTLSKMQRNRGRKDVFHVVGRPDRPEDPDAREMPAVRAWL